MKLNIQLFGDFDEIIDIYNNQINSTKNEMATINNEKNTLLNEYNTNYQNQLTEHENLMNQQQQNIDRWAETQKETQQKQTDYNIGLINQNKAETQKQTDAELGNAYIDYQKGLNQFGGNAESMASSGLAGTGFAKNADIAMNITYQNRVSSAKSALMKANTDYDNQIQQALLNNDAALAEVALQQMQQSYQLALQGFEYKTNLYNNKLSYEQSINDSYFARSQDLQSRIDTYNNALANINQAQIQLDEQRKQNQREYEQWEREFNAKNQQWRDEFNAKNSQWQKEFNAIYGSNTTYTDGNGGYDDTPKQTQLTPTPKATVTPYGHTEYNKDALTNGKVDKNKVFDNGYQPNNYNGTKLKKSGYVVSDYFGIGNTGSTGHNIDNQNIWKAGNKYLIWDGSQNKYIDITNKIKGGSGSSGGGGGAGGFG